MLTALRDDITLNALRDMWNLLMLKDGLQPQVRQC